MSEGVLADSCVTEMLAIGRGLAYMCVKEVASFSHLYLVALFFYLQLRAQSRP